jgi:hypothetical protein
MFTCGRSFIGASFAGLSPEVRRSRRPHTAKVARRKLANKLVGVLHGCLTHRELYDELQALRQHVREMAA